MTETDADIEKRPTFAANRPNDVLKDIALSNLHLYALFADSGDFAINTTNGNNVITNLKAV